MQLSQSQSSLQQLQHQFSQEREHLRMQLDELQTEHQRRQQRLQEVHVCAVQEMERTRQRDLKVGGASAQAPPCRCRNTMDVRISSDADQKHFCY